MTLIDTIRAQYPHPRRIYHDGLRDESYCVGGALCRYVGITHPSGGPARFPEPLDIRTALQRLNPHLSASEARFYASEIVYENDTAHFEAAWQVAEVALTQKD